MSLSSARLTPRLFLAAIARVATVVLVLVLCGCSGPQSSMDPAGTQARQLLEVGEYFFWVCLVVYLIVVAILFRSLIRSRGERKPWDLTPDTAPVASHERLLTQAVVFGAIATAVVLLMLLTMDLMAAQAISSLRDPDELTIEVTGRQWWWEFQYSGDRPSDEVVTANEIHIPVGRTVHFRLTSADVIHSFWVPNLHGKRDLFPGQETSLRVEADSPGTYMGQCAEFCGLQHSLMRFVVVVESAEEFADWLENQRQPAKEPTTEQAQRGKKLFNSTTCAMCHSVRGTEAFGSVGPDLTHFASRRSLGAGSLPNTPGHVGGWITDPQQIKPGVRMPQHAYSPQDLRDLIAYLEVLE